MHVIGFDFGLKYIGVAVGDNITKMAFPLKSFLIINKIYYWGNIFNYITLWSPKVIIIGNPKNKCFNNKVLMKNIDKFIYKINKTMRMPIYFVNEYLSTWEAKHKNLCKKNSNYFIQINALSAVILIEQWFFSNKI